MHPINLPRHIKIVLGDAARRMRAERTYDLGVADVDIRMVIGCLGSLADRRDEVDSGQEIPKLERLRDYIPTPTPSLETSQLALYCNVR